MKLSKAMSLDEFDNGYWYAQELKAFAKAIGIPRASSLRKDQLEAAIKRFLSAGTITRGARKPAPLSDTRDTEHGLRSSLRIVRYTNNKETKTFLEREALKLAPGLKRKSGARYRLNRWREKQLQTGVRLTYGDLVKEYVRLSQPAQRFAQIPHGRYINFLSDFFAAEKGAPRAQAIQAWKKLKTLDVPKTYRAWVQSQSSERRRTRA